MSQSARELESQAKVAIREEAAVEVGVVKKKNMVEAGEEEVVVKSQLLLLRKRK